MLRALAGPLTLGLLASTGVRAECDGAVKVACTTYPRVCGRALESCSLSTDVAEPHLSHGLLRYAPHEKRAQERRHWQLSCDETSPGAWSCGPLGVTTTARVGEPDDWAEILGPISLERAQEIAEFARAGTLPAADIEYVLAGGGVFIVAVNVPGEARVCLSLTPRDAGFAAARLKSC